eukprot:c45789_g1_i1 orf=280-450(+)
MICKLPINKNSNSLSFYTLYLVDKPHNEVEKYKSCRTTTFEHYIGLKEVRSVHGNA